MVPVWWVSLVLGGGREVRSATLHGASTGAGGVHLCENTRGVGCLHSDSMSVSMDVSSGASTRVWEGGLCTVEAHCEKG
jgi:hypothetical protein